MVRGEGFEPPTFTTKGTDLQSVAEPPSLPPTHNFIYMVLPTGYDPVLRVPQTRVLPLH